MKLGSKQEKKMVVKSPRRRWAVLMGALLPAMKDAFMDQEGFSQASKAPNTNFFSWMCFVAWCIATPSDVL